MARILAFSDDRKLLDELKEVLTSDTNQVAFCPIPQFILRRMIVTTYQLFVMDVDVPNFDIEDTLNAIRDISPNTRIIVLTSHYQKEKVSEYLNLGVKDVLVKPIHPHLMVKHVNSVLSK